ncbi:MAG: DUF342 domain-containing protein [Syntrophomonadaceae bacterium]|nr:DUF342 domain-containing protein [Syntrophomonadaceae bacterium]
MDFQIRIARDRMAAYIRLLEEKQQEAIPAGEVSAAEKGEQADEKDKPMEPPLLSREAVAARLEEAGVVFGIDWENVDALILHQVKGEEICIAKGLPPKPGKDAYIQPVYLEKQIKTQEIPDDKMVDYLDYGRIVSVEPGELLAVKVPPQPGEPGKNVLGQNILPPPAKNPVLIAGPGVKIEDGGLRVVATASGRPEQKNNLFAVYPTHTVNGNVDAVIGHIKFKGDLVIKGSIAEGMRVEAKGKLDVHGSIAHSTVSAGGSIKVGQSILGSTVRAGGPWVQFKLAHDLLSKTVAVFEELMASARQLKDHPGFAGTVQVKQNGEGIIIKILMEKKYSNLPDSLTDLAEKLDKLEQEAFPVEALEQLRANCLEALSRFTGLGPLRFGSLDDAQTIIEKLKAGGRQFSGCYLNEDMEQANITASYAQNTKLFASGTVKITGKGAYYCDIAAAKDVLIEGRPGIFRNGSIVAGRNVRVLELGSPLEAATRVEIPSGAVISAGKVYPGVFLKAGARGDRIQTFVQGLKFSD